MRWVKLVDSGAPKDRRLSPIVRLAPAKLNLSLAILGRRPDGFHDLHSIMVPLGLADCLSVARAQGSEDTLRVTGHDAGSVADNLVLRAIAVTRSAVGRPVDAFPLAARLEKYIPVAAGLAGGSSDAAAAIDAALVAWGVDLVLEPAELATLRHRVAVQLGSDVPFFLAGTAAVVTGSGDSVDPLPGLRGTPPGVLLVTAGVPGPTARVFEALDLGGAGAPGDPGSTRAASEHLAGEWRAGLRADALLTRAGVLASANDLAAAADVVVPGLRSLRRGLVRRLGRPVGLSGSGPTLWVLYASEAEAASAVASVLVALGDGSIVAPGDERPSVVATTVSSSHRISRSRCMATLSRESR